MEPRGGVGLVGLAGQGLQLLADLFLALAQVVRGEADRRVEVAEIVEVQEQRLVQHQVLLLDQVGLAVLPRLLGHARRTELRRKGSPGANCMIRKETIVTPNSVGIMISRRRRM